MKKVIAFAALILLFRTSAISQSWEVGHRTGLSTYNSGESDYDYFKNRAWGNEIYLQKTYHRWTADLSASYYNNVKDYQYTTSYYPYPSGPYPVYDTATFETIKDNFYMLCLMLKYNLYKSRNNKFKVYIGLNLSYWRSIRLEQVSVFPDGNENLDKTVKHAWQDIYYGPNISLAYQLDKHLSVSLLGRIQGTMDANSLMTNKWDYMLGLGYKLGSKKHSNKLK